MNVLAVARIVVLAACNHCSITTTCGPPMTRLAHRCHVVLHLVGCDQPAHRLAAYEERRTLLLCTSLLLYKGVQIIHLLQSIDEAVMNR